MFMAAGQRSWDCLKINYSVHAHYKKENVTQCTFVPRLCVRNSFGSMEVYDTGNKLHQAVHA